MVTTGIEQLCRTGLPWKKGQRVGLLANQASVDSAYHHSRDLIRQMIGSDLTCLFSPQHGFNGDKQDNMIESDHGVDPVTRLPVFSLYGDTRRPTADMFAEIDLLVIDIVDVGTRVYTFLYTMAYCLEAAAEYGKRVVVLDRPNPVGGDAVEGNILKDELFSFVGLYPIPMRHGLTFGELATYINCEFNIGADLDVVKMAGWRRSMFFRDTGLPWVFPSPNMPTPETAVVYPGQVIWEGTEVSEGRGTTLPFELVGAPYWDSEEIIERLDMKVLPGCFFRSLIFEPTSGKWSGTRCHGFQIHVTDRQLFRPYRTSLALFKEVMSLYPDDFIYKDPPYEYEFKKLPMDLILGDRSVRKKLESGWPVLDIEELWQEELNDFDQRRRDFFLY